jgi:murein DD-endopeptidase MepM/ murein hydrolase activator NlpD
LKVTAEPSAARRRAIVLIPLGVCLIIGAIVFLNRQRPPDSAGTSPPILLAPAPSESGTPGKDSTPKTRPPAEPPGPKAATPSAAPPPGYPGYEGASAVPDADLSYLAAKNLLIPVAGVKAAQLRDTFNQARSEGRRHDAIDIMAPQGTPVLAAADGPVIKLFQSEKGGITLYQQDPSGRYVYYYAHLMRYADGIVEGKELKRGDVIAYVGDTGDAGTGNFHLHFAISKVSFPRKWSGGDPINPYPLLKGK